MSEQGLLCNEASLRHCQAQWMLFGTFRISWMQKFTQEPCQEGQAEQQPNKQSWKRILQWAQSQPSLLMGIPSTGAPNAHHLSGLLLT